MPERERCVQLGAPDLAALRRLADLLAGHEGQIARRWEELYALAFARRGYHVPGEFRAEARAEIQEILDHVRRGDLAGLSAWFRAHAKSLFERGVPFPETCRSLHLFEESVLSVLRGLGCSAEDMLELFGAFDGLSHERIILIVETYHKQASSKWMERQDSVLTGLALRESERGARDRLCGLVGKSPAMQCVFEYLQLAAASRDAVLLVGPTGTGKELAARTIHALSGDPSDRFVPVNCAAISGEILESELFGHRRGSFSGAHTDHAGLFRAAHGGSIFLDEITELPVGAQAKLLRVLQERAVRPVGGIDEIPVTVRILASSNRDLDEALAAGRIRRDLYYRLRQLVVALPSLDERRDDIPLLVDHFAAKAATDGLCARPPAFSDEALERLAAREWRGNVRELENVVRLACRMVRGVVVEAHHLTDDVLGGAAPAPRGEAAAAGGGPISMRDAERDAIERALRATDGNKTRAARLLGISRKQLYVRLRRFGLGT